LASPLLESAGTGWIFMALVNQGRKLLQLVEHKVFDNIGFRGRRDNERKGDCLLIACLSSRNSEPKYAIQYNCKLNNRNSSSGELKTRDALANPVTYSLTHSIT
jgi:hypothetical protein